MNNALENKAKIRFQDCDPFNHLNNSKYIDYFINAREDQVLEHYNLDIYEHIKKYGKGWLVKSNQITYIRPAFMMEEVVIESQLIQYTSNYLKVEMKMWNNDKTTLKSIFWTTFAYIDIQKQEKTDHSQELLDLFSQIVKPIELTSFEERCTAIIQSLRRA